MAKSISFLVQNTSKDKIKNITNIAINMLINIKTVSLSFQAKFEQRQHKVEILSIQYLWHRKYGLGLSTPEIILIIQKIIANLTHHCFSQDHSLFKKHLIMNIIENIESQKSAGVLSMR